MLEINKIHNYDALKGLKLLVDSSVNCCVTSPPYFGLRLYGTDPIIWDGDENCQHEWADEIIQRQRGISGGATAQTGTHKRGIQETHIKQGNFCIKCGCWKGELGAEPTPELYVKHIVDIFREVKRVLKKDGTLWLNLGDSYAGLGKGSGQKPDHKNCGKIKQKKGYDVPRSTPSKEIGLKPKDLIGIPWLLAFALRNDGWYLRSDIIWAKGYDGKHSGGSVMPESVQDRPTKAHEYLFLLSKSLKYYYDYKAIQVNCCTFDNSNRNRDSTKLNNTPERTKMMGLKTNKYEYHNKRDVWLVNPGSFKDAHFAVYPEELIVDCIKAGCPVGGTVIDSFMGSGTTAVVARKLNRNFIGFELNSKYIAIANKRLYEELGMFL